MRKEKEMKENGIKEGEISSNNSINKNWIIGILIVIILLIVAALFTAIYYKSPIVKNYLSIASQITSIVLAVVAIIYAFIQSNRADMQYDRMSELLYNITIDINKLLNIKDENDKTSSELLEVVNQTKDSQENKSEKQNQLEAIEKKLKETRNRNSSIGIDYRNSINRDDIILNYIKKKSNNNRFDFLNKKK